jgi:hypothetical protein
MASPRWLAAGAAITPAPLAANGIFRAASAVPALLLFARYAPGHQSLPPAPGQTATPTCSPHHPPMGGAGQPEPPAAAGGDHRHQAGLNVLTGQPDDSLHDLLAQAGSPPGLPQGPRT